LQVKLCDPRLSALSVPWCKKALYKYSSFPFLLMEFANSITSSSSLAGSRAGLRPASELDCVMEFGLNALIWQP